MNARSRIHVVHNSTADRWEAKHEGANQPVSRHLTKDAAIDAGRAEAKRAPLGQLLIHGMDGRIQTEYTYGRDPYPPKG